MATASILSRVTLPIVKADVTDASRDDLAVNDVVELESVNVGTAYQWSIAFKPEDLSGTPSTAVFSSTGTEQAINKDPGTFTVDLDGPYLLRLVYTTPQITLNTVLSAGVSFSINGITLTAVAGARTPGSDDFSIAGGTVALITAEMAAAINDPANSFVAANLAGTDASPSVVISPTLETVPTGETVTITYSGVPADVTLGDFVTEQYVRLRALTAFGDLKLVAAGERYDTLRVPVDAQPDGWADNQNYNLSQLVGLIGSSAASTGVVYVDPVNGDYQTIQAAMDYADSQSPTAAQQWVVLVRPGTYVEDLTFYQWVHLFGWPGGEGTPLVTVQNDTVVSHDISLPGVGSSLVLCNLHFERPAVSPNAVISQAANGTVKLVRCRVDGSGAGGAYASSGDTTFIECRLAGEVGSAPPDYAVTLSGSTTFDRCTVTGQSGIFLDVSSALVLRDTQVNTVGTASIDAFSDFILRYCQVVGPIRGNPTGAGTAGDIQIDIKWSQVADISLDGTAVVGTASLSLGSTSHGTLTTAGGATQAATVPADSVFYDNATSGIAAENVQDAIDEVYAFAALVRTLDDAYNGGVAASGSGRTIIADQGAVQIVDAVAPSDPIPPGNTNGNLEVVGSVSLGALTKPEITLDPNPFGNGPTVLLGREIWANDAPFGSTALILGDASGNPTYHNYNLRVGTQSADGGNQVGSLYLRAGDSLTTIDAGSVFIQGGTATDAGGGTGGDIYIVPGETAAGGARSLILVNPLTATPATLTAAGAFSGAAVAGDITIGSELGAVTVSFAGGENLAAVHALFDATGVVTAAGDPIVLTSVAKGATAEVFFISADAGVDASLGVFSGQAMVAGTWPDSTAIAATGTSEITFGAGNPNPMIYDSATGKLTVPGLIDPTGMVFDEAGQPATGANKGALFVSDGSGGLVLNHLYYVNAAGTPTDITTGGGGGVTDLQGAYDGGNTIVTALGNDIDLTLSAAGGGFTVNGDGAVAFGNGTEVASFRAYSETVLTLQSRDDSILWMQANDGADKTLTVKATNAGAGAGHIQIEAGDEIQLVPGSSLAPGSATKATLPDLGFMVFGTPELGVAYVPFFNAFVIGLPPDALASGGSITVSPATTPQNILVQSVSRDTSGVGAGSDSGNVNIETGSTTSASGDAAGNSGGITIKTGGAAEAGAPATAGGVSGDIGIETGQSGFSGTGDIGIRTGQNSAASNASTGQIELSTGNQNGTGAVSGNITLTTGASTTNSGTLNLQTGSSGATRGDVSFDTRSLQIRESTGPSGGSPQRGHLHVADGATPGLIQNSLYYTDATGTQTRINAPSLDRHHINMPEAPNNTVEYKGWASYACVLTKVKVLCATANTQGTLILTVTNNATGNTVLSANTLNLNEAGSGGILTDDTIYTDGLGAPADLSFAVDDRWTITLTSNDPAMDAAGIYIDLTFEVK